MNFSDTVESFGYLPRETGFIWMPLWTDGPLGNYRLKSGHYGHMPPDESCMINPFLVMCFFSMMVLFTQSKEISFPLFYIIGLSLTLLGG